MAIGVGTTALVARSWGAGQREEASRITSASLMFGGLVGLVLMIFGMLFSHQIAEVFGLDEHAAQLASRNIFWLSAFIIGFAIDIILSSALRAAGNAWTPLLFGLAVNLINLPLLYAFILGNFGAPRMGAAGAPFASGLSFVLCGAVLVVLWMRQKLTIKFFPGDIFKKARYQRLLHIGYPVALEQLVLQFGFFLFMSLIGHYYGTEAFAAYNVGVNMLNAAMVVGSGFSIAGATLVGQHLGAGDVDGAARSGWRACSMAVARDVPDRLPHRDQCLRSGAFLLGIGRNRRAAHDGIHLHHGCHAAACWASTWPSAVPCAAPATRVSRS